MEEPTEPSRRDFLAATTAALLALSGAEEAGGAGSRAPGDASLVTGPIPGEPYDLAGKRIFFTNWHYVRPGELDWLDSAGKSVFMTGSEGPWGAHFKGIDAPYGIRLAAQPAERRGPILAAERPWEAGGVHFTTVIQEGHAYRAWGDSDSSKPGEKRASHPCYLESRDGLTWERPDVGLVEFQGSRANNLLAPPFGTVFLDPSAPPDERYKSVWTAEISVAEFEAYRKARPGAWEPKAVSKLLKEHPNPNVDAILGSISPDGLRWTRLPLPLAVETTDTQLVGYFDERTRKYVIYTRWWWLGERTKRPAPGISGNWGHVGRRAVGRTESRDFRRFPNARMVLAPSPDMSPAETLYTSCKTTFPGAPDQHLMFPAVYHLGDDTTHLRLASSPDGETWHFVPGPPLLETSAFGAWDGGALFAHPNLIELPDGSFVLPYTGYNFPHKYPRGQWTRAAGYAVWPKGRLVALEAPERGEFAMVALMPPGRRLRINAVTKRAGSIRVQVDRVSGRTFEDAAPIIGDQHWSPVTWQGHEDMGHPEGAPVLLRVRMDKAKLFGLEFA